MTIMKPLKVLDRITLAHNIAPFNRKNHKLKKKTSLLRVIFSSTEDRCLTVT